MTVKRAAPALPQLGAGPPWAQAYAKLALLITAGLDVIGGAFFEYALRWLLAVPVLAALLLLPVCALGLLAACLRCCR